MNETHYIYWAYLPCPVPKLPIYDVRYIDVNLPNSVFNRSFSKRFTTPCMGSIMYLGSTLEFLGLNKTCQNIWLVISYSCSWSLRIQNPSQDAVIDVTFLSGLSYKHISRYTKKLLHKYSPKQYWYLSVKIKKNTGNILFSYRLIIYKTFSNFAQRSLFL